MAFILQTDDGLTAEANAYISVEFFKAFHTDRDRDVCNLTDVEIQAAIVKATEFIDGKFTYRGAKLNGRSQTTEFPRRCLIDRDGKSVDGIPREVKNSVAEYAFFAITTPLTRPTTTPTMDLKLSSSFSKVGPLEEKKTYYQISESTYREVPDGDKWIIGSGFVLIGNRMRRA